MLVCTASDVQFAGNPYAGASPLTTTTCVGGTHTTLSNLTVQVDAGSSSRYNLGLFIGNDGRNIQLQSAAKGGQGNATCSNYVFPEASPFQNLDANVCGDVNASTAASNPMFGTFLNVELYCAPGANG